MLTVHKMHARKNTEKCIINTDIEELVRLEILLSHVLLTHSASR